MGNEPQVDKLNARVLLRIAPSKIHGVGIFAVRDIAKGQKLFADNMPEVYTLKHAHFSKLFPEVADLLLGRWPQIVNGSNFIYPDARMIAYCNHSDDPNYDGNLDIAIRDIKQGEEITEDYRRIDNYDKVFPWLKKPLDKKRKVIR